MASSGHVIHDCFGPFAKPNGPSDLAAGSGVGLAARLGPGASTSMLGSHLAFLEMPTGPKKASKVLALWALGRCFGP